MSLLPKRKPRAPKPPKIHLDENGLPMQPAQQFSFPNTIDGLPQLQSRQFAYVKARCDGLKVGEAYDFAYRKGKPPQTRDSKWYCASHVEHNRLVQQWLNAAREQALLDVRTTREQHSARLSSLSHKAEAEGKYSSAIQAEYYRGRAERLYVDIVEHRNGDMDLQKFVMVVAELLGPEQAKLAASKLGVDFKQIAAPIDKQKVLPRLVEANA